jgi:hypothetical protein
LVHIARCLIDEVVRSASVRRERQIFNRAENAKILVVVPVLFEQNVQPLKTALKIASGKSREIERALIEGSAAHRSEASITHLLQLFAGEERHTAF